MEIAGTRYVIDGVAVFVCGFDDMSEEEMKKYLAYVRPKVKAPLLELVILLPRTERLLSITSARA